MPEGLSPVEVGKEIGEHRKHTAEGHTDHDRHDRWLSIVEALLLSLVAVLAAYSGYAAAKWGTESSLTLASASAARTKANRADTEAIVVRTLDSASFNAWFTAFTAGNANAERLAEKRLRPGYRPAFRAWLATDPEHNPNAPAGPAYMPQYVIPQEATAKAHDAQADAAFARGSEAGETADRVHPGNRIPRDRAVPGGRQRALPDSPGAHRPDQRGRIVAGVRGDPVAEPSRTAVIARANSSRLSIPVSA